MLKFKAIRCISESLSVNLTEAKFFALKSKCSVSQAELLGRQVAEEILAMGGKAIFNASLSGPCMTILVVRPAPACDELVASLQQKQMKAIAAPLQTFSLGKRGDQWVEFCQAPTRQTAVVAVSPRAVQFADQILSSTKTTWPRNIHYIAVGKATADAFLSHAKIQAQILEKHDSEGLYHCLNSQQKSFTKVVILRGNGGREFLGQQLCQNGVNVCYVEVYQRHWDSELAKAHLPHWQNQGVNTLVISSGEQLMQFINAFRTRVNHGSSTVDYSSPANVFITKPSRLVFISSTAFMAHRITTF